MPKCIAAVFAAAWNLTRALISGLFSQPKGRHSRHSAEQLRRRRSTRVRPYAPMTPAAPERLPSHPTVRKHDDVPEEPPALKPPTAEYDADEVALVRPYFRAHEAAAAAESAAARTQNRAAARLRAWGADLDHLEFGPDSPFSFGRPPAGTRAYTLDDYPRPGSAPDPDPERPTPFAAPAAPSDPTAPAAPTATFHVPAPRTPAPRVPARMNGLPHLSRIRERQQARRGRTQGRHGRVLAGSGT